MLNWRRHILQGRFSRRGEIEGGVKFILFKFFSAFRRPNPIPILAPPDHKKSQGSSAGDDSEKNADDKGAENIDHILDNMFVQRQPFEPSISSLKEAPSAVGGDDSQDQLNDGMNVSSINMQSLALN